MRETFGAILDWAVDHGGDAYMVGLFAVGLAGFGLPILVALRGLV